MVRDAAPAGGFEGDPYPIVQTLEGPMLVSPGDYIITGVAGEQYPCKPDIFEKTYIPVSMYVCEKCGKEFYAEVDEDDGEEYEPQSFGIYLIVCDDCYYELVDPILDDSDDWDDDWEDVPSEDWEEKDDEYFETVGVDVFSDYSAFNGRYPIPDASDEDEFAE